jgi:hypothetical protein
MWTVIYVAYNKNDAKKIRNILQDEGFLVRINILGMQDDPLYEIMVPNGEIEEAHEVLINL